ncbi:hypothetical protein CDEF62S_03021 [Castellaniella defragrans]
MKLRKINKDYYGGALMIFIGLGTLSEGLSYQVGTLARIRSGFFPAIVGALFVIVGVLIAIGGLSRHTGDEPDQRPEWRGWFCILGGIVAFIVLGTYTGLLPASFAVVFISAMGDRNNTIKGALVLSLAMCVIAVVVFWWLLQLQFPLLQWAF